MASYFPIYLYVHHLVLPVGITSFLRPPSPSPPIRGAAFLSDAIVLKLYPIHSTRRWPRDPHQVPVGAGLGEVRGPGRPRGSSDTFGFSVAAILISYEGWGIHFLINLCTRVYLVCMYQLVLEYVISCLTSTDVTNPPSAFRLPRGHPCKKDTSKETRCEMRGKCNCMHTLVLLIIVCTS